jgi:hypothetical protein
VASGPDGGRSGDGESSGWVMLSMAADCWAAAWADSGSSKMADGETVGWAFRNAARFMDFAGIFAGT